MLSNKPGKVSPLFDFYEETDLDNVDEQPIDFSKRYSDLESDHVSKSVAKKRHISTASLNSEPTSCKQPCEDDLRVYCIEGTPLLISTSSSISDLRYVGASESAEPEILKKIDEVKTDFPSSCCTETNVEILKNSSEEEKIEESPMTEGDKSCESKEDENIQIIDGDESISKVSSPLMFSRSSSVCSLNSFEQNSIIDDRSSVSILSNLTSGIISPSDIPDSPGEAMLSPSIDKNKQSEFKFPICENEITNVCNESYEDGPFDDVKVYNIEGDCSPMSSFSELSIHTSSHMSVTYVRSLKNNLNANEEHSLRINCTANIDICSFEDSKVDFSNSTQNLTLDKQSPVSFNVVSHSNQTPVQCDKSFNKHKSEDFTIEQNFIKQEVEIEKETVAISLTKEENHSQIEKVEVLETNNNVISSEDESDALIEECIKRGRSNMQTAAKKYSLSEASLSSQKSTSNIYDDENDLLIKECIDLGRPQKLSSGEKLRKAVNNSDPQSSKSQKQKLKNLQQNSRLKPGQTTECYQMDAYNSDAFAQGKKYSSQQSTNKYFGMKPFRPLLSNKTTDPVKNLRKEILMGVFKTMNEKKPEKTSKSAPSDSDDDEMLLNQCIKLGMPDKKNKSQSQSHQLPSKLNAGHLPENTSQNQLESKYVQNHSPSKTSSVFTQARKDHVLLQSRATQVKTSHRNRQSQSVSYNQFSSKKHQVSSSANNYSCQELEKNKKYFEMTKKERNCKLERNPVDDRSNFLLQQRMQLGMPSKSVSKYSKDKELMNNNSLPNANSLGYRDNRPDGTSDVEEDDDDILLKCINAGKPKQENRYSKPQCSPSKTNFNCKLNNKVTSQQLPVNLDKKGIADKMKQGVPCQSPKKQWPPPFLIPDEDSMTGAEESLCIYKTEDTPVLSPTASISDLSTLSFNEDKQFPPSHLNNSRNSDCSSESDDDDELLLECIRAGMPAAKRALA